MTDRTLNDSEVLALENIPLGLFKKLCRSHRLLAARVKELETELHKAAEAMRGRHD